MDEWRGQHVSASFPLGLRAFLDFRKCILCSVVALDACLHKDEIVIPQRHLPVNHVANIL